MKSYKPDEMEQKHNLISARNAFIFYGIVLFIWSIYDLVTVGALSWQFAIFAAGQIVFWLSRVFLGKKVESRKDTKI